MKATYQKYKDTETGEYKYQLSLPDGTTHWSSLTLGEYVHQLERRLELAEAIKKM